jgi:hypothetical protein
VTILGAHNHVEQFSAICSCAITNGPLYEWPPHIALALLKPVTIAWEADQRWRKRGVGIDKIFHINVLTLCNIGKVIQENQVCLELNGAHQLLVYADVNLLGDCTNIIKENIETLEASMDIGLEINAEKTKYMIMSRHPNSGQNQNISITNESFESVAKFKYLWTTLTNQNDIHDESKSRLNSGNVCYHSG